MMPIIKSYSFGRMIIAGSTYTRDVIIFPDGSILSPWWRKEGHVLIRSDLVDLLAAKPQVIVCGTGAMGVMRPAAELQHYLAAHHIDFIAQKSSRAVETYNRMTGRNGLGACFHLTC
jgi:hypothetical protein